MNVYTANTLVQLAAAFITPAGAPVSPSAVVCNVLTPSGAMVSLTVSNASTGNYTAQYLPTAPGLYKYEFIGSGVVEAAQIGAFLVNQATF